MPAGTLERGLLLRRRFELGLYVNRRPFVGGPGSVAEGAGVRVNLSSERLAALRAALGGGSGAVSFTDTAEWEAHPHRRLRAIHAGVDQELASGIDRLCFLGECAWPEADPLLRGEWERFDAVLNAVDRRFVMPIFRAALDAGVTYLDMAMSLSRPHPSDPHRTPGVKLGDEQFAMAAQWEERGLLALCGMGVEPGLSDVFARHASDRLFSAIDEIGVRDGANLVVEGYDFCPTFSIWTTIEECLNPPVVWERGREWFTTEPFSEPETFVFPAGIGPIECVNVEHEEVLLMPRWLDAGRVTFKYGLGDEFIGVLQTLHQLGLDATEPVQVGSVEVSPRDVVAACLPAPAEIGDRLTGLTCARTWVRGAQLRVSGDCAACSASARGRAVRGGCRYGRPARRWTRPSDRASSRSPRCNSRGPTPRSPTAEPCTARGSARR